MIAIGKPYVSDFLLESIQKSNYPVISTAEAREVIKGNRVNWISEIEAKELLKEKSGTKVYTNSENTIGWLENNATHGPLPEQIQLFKNKIRFRELLAGIYPDYYFQGVEFSRLREMDAGKLNFPFIIKPAVGFFSVAVHRVENRDEWHQVLDLIDIEVKAWEGTYPREVIDTSEFIIEECIEGEEYAIDCYFNQKGEPVILNILHHLFSSGKDVSDRVYTTSENIINQHKEGVQKFLEMIGSKTGLANFPLHVEVRIDQKGMIIPIEINPLRFGGWCTTGDLTWYAYGINSYDSYFNEKQPLWDEIFRTRKDKKFSVVVLDNNSGYPEKQIESFNFQLIASDFEKILDIREVDFRTYGVFGFLFVETSSGNEDELTRILTSDLRRYIILKGSQ
ncbi:MAG: ATP-grasp domain-containing protein [Bacteroidetes bacterium]|nr:MAG: ATP-grasp domain-containing protein [Bacteroidota bacterium]